MKLQPRKPQFWICAETFSGDLSGGRGLTFHKGESVLDSADPHEAALLAKWGAYFKVVRSTYIHAPTEEH